MKKVLSLIAILCMSLVFFVGCDFLSQFTKTPCEHNWVDATCTEPKTCSECGETDGEPNGHTEETIAGKAATCTEAGLTEGKKCTVCGETTVQQTVIAALGHTEEIIAGTAATCTEAGQTDGKKCTVCGVTTVQQTVIDALNHKPEADDGDVTTPVKCANEGCDEILVDAKEAITLTISTLENGAVVADKKNYAMGDTVKLTINPDFGYTQKLYIDGEPLMLDWNNNVYSFVVEKDTYVIDGTFEQSLNLNPSDPARWDTTNHAHGVISGQYNATSHGNDSWWFDFNGEYSSISVKAKNALSIEDSMDGNGNVGFSFVLRINLDNGKFYAFRIINDKGTYAFDKYGAGGSATGWGNWKALDAAAVAALNGDGVDFKLERTGDNILTLSVNGAEVFTYTMEGVTASNKVTSVGMRQYGNSDIQVDIPFVLTVPEVEEEPPVSEGDEITLTIGEFANGTVTAGKDSYNVGDTVTLTVSPAEGYFQKLYINGEPLMLGWKTYTYSFTATENAYEITGSFEKGISLTPSDAGRWDDHNQAHGVISTQYSTNHNNESWWFDFNGDYSSISVKVKNYLPLEDSKDGEGKTGFSFVLRISLDNGKFYAFRVINDKGTYAFDKFGGSGSATGWGNWQALDSDAATALNGDGVDFKLERTGDNILTLSVNGAEVFTYTMEGVTADNKVTSVGLRHYGNSDIQVDIPFVLTVPVEEEPPVYEGPVTLNISEFANGTVAADKDSYNVGDTVTLTVSPAEGYFQKLYVNGEPLMLGWNTYTYSFTATENAYEITGSFEKGISLTPSDAGRWDDHNQAHGVLSTYYPNNNDSWWMAINGNYNSLTVKAQNQLPIGDTKDNFYVYLRVTMENGNSYIFRIGTDKGGYTAYNRAGIQNSGDATADWGGWKNLSHLDSAVCGDGVDFKVERTDANILTLTVNGEVVDTYTMNGITAEDKIASIAVKHQGNQGKYVDIPFTLTVPTVE